MTIGTVARAAGVRIDTIRYYERRGLLPLPARSPAGYRQYAEEVVQRIRYIKRAQRLGFTLAQILELLRLQFETDPTCDDLAHRVTRKLTEIDEKIAELQATRVSLLAVLARCPSDCSQTCTVLLDDPSPMGAIHPEGATRPVGSS